VTEACWCCGQQYAERELVRLGSHPEVAVCGRCARFLVRRSRAQRDEYAPSAGARARAVLDRSRDVVIEHGWHRLPVVGPVLRWMGDRLP
jgi:hypothetical protein